MWVCPEKFGSCVVLGYAMEMKERCHRTPANAVHSSTTVPNPFKDGFEFRPVLDLLEVQGLHRCSGHHNAIILVLRKLRKALIKLGEVLWVRVFRGSPVGNTEG